MKQDATLIQTELNALEAELMLLESIRPSDPSAPRAGALQPILRDGPIPLSFAQQRLWFLDRLMPNNAAYNIFNAVRLSGSLDVATLERCFNEIVRRHESLRTTFATESGQPVQVIAPTRMLPLPLVDLGSLSQEAQELAVPCLAAEEAQRPFGLTNGPLMRAILLRVSQEEHVLLVNMHHIVTDGWSMGILIREVAALYEAFALGKPSPLPALPIQYADFAVWQREWLQGEVLQDQIAYWKQQLAGAPAGLEIPADRPRPAVQTFHGKTLLFTLPQHLSDRLRQLSQQTGCTSFMTLLAVFKALLYRYTGQTDILVGTPVANRNRAEIEGLIGFFVNTLVLRTHLSGASDPLTFRELLERVRETTLKAYAYQDVPFEKLVEELQPERDLSRSALFQVMFALMVPVDTLETPGLTLSPLDVEMGRAQFDLTLFMLETERGFSGRLEYNIDLFDAATAYRLIDHYQTLLQGAVADPDRRLSELPLLTEAEQQQLLVEWNDTRTDYPGERCIHHWFEAQAEGTPDAVALVFDDQFVTYREMNRRANQLAHYLSALETGPDVRIGICTERSLEMVIGLYGILKAGGAYVPLDPTYPPERLAYMLADAQVPVLLTQAKLLTTLPSSPSRIVCLDADWDAIARQPSHSPAGALTDDHLAYLIYTSGSTGKPKGAMNTHGGIRNRLLWMQEAYRLTPADRILQKTPFSFDVSVWEFFWPLMFGACLVVARPEGHKDSAYLAGLIGEQSITTLHFVPSMLHMFLEQRDLETCTSLRRVLCSGEALPFSLQQRFFARLSCELHNLYGPTEAAVDVTAWACRRESTQPNVPIGQPIANTQIYVLDEQLRPTPVGVPGELHIGGAGLARGYHNRPELTAAKFIPNPFTPPNPPPSPTGGAGGGRLYKTGDLARYLPDGSIEYVGRIDHQVKVRGFRIELGEIESVLREYTPVAEAVVVVREDRPGDKRLVAYVVAQAGQSPASGELRRFLEARLPEYMLPSAFVLLETLPLSPNGKVDRRALPAPKAERPEVIGVSVAPRSEAERIIVAIWKDLLGVEQVGAHDNFFDLGGHSLLLMQAHTRLTAAFDKEFPLTDLFRYTTVASLAQYLNPTPGQADAVRPTDARRRQQAEGSDIAIIGMVGRFPGADTLDQFWDNLCNGVESVTRFSDEQLLAAGVDADLLDQPHYVKTGTLLSDIDRFDARFFGVNPREAEVMDPQQRLFLETAWHALEDAGYDPHRYNGRIGVYAGQTVSSYLLNNLVSNQGRTASPSSFQVLLSNNTDYLATQVAYRLGLSGPALSVQTACSTSLVAVHLACQSLIHGECDIALAGGVSLRVPQITGYLYEPGGILSPDGHCRPFDAGAQGTIGGSGLGVVILKPLAEALDDGDTIHAVIKGSAINNDGARKIGYTAPSEDGQVEVIRDALAVAGWAPEAIGYIEAHGTGTVLGDPIEVTALIRVFRASTQATSFCGLGSLKGNIGHLDAAAGVAGLIKTVLTLEHKQLPPSINLTSPNPQIDFANSPFYVNAMLREWETIDGRPRRAGVSSFGIGGTNAHVVLEEAPLLPPTDRRRGGYVLSLSALTEEALEKTTANLAAHLRRHPQLNLADVAYTLQVGRRPFAHRRILACEDVPDAIAVLESRDPKRMFTAWDQRRHRTLVFMFPGQGAQYVNMGRGLYESEPCFRETMDHCAMLLKPRLGLDLLDTLYPEPGREAAAADRLDQTLMTQPALFAIEYALARLWQAWGLHPQAMIGHSIGEYVAACLAGVFSLEDALALVAHRGRLIQRLPGGSMLSVSLAEAEIHPYLGDQLALAAVNAPRLCVVSGTSEAIESLRAQLEAKDIGCRLLHTSHAFHSTMIEPALDAFAACVERVQRNPPSLPFVSNVTGTWITADEATDPRYWARHLRHSVRFAEGLQALLAGEEPVLLEVGPGRTLSTFARQQNAPTALTSLRHPDDKQADRLFLLTTLGRLWTAGLDVDWRNFYADERRRRVPLPVYPFERERYWVEPRPAGINLSQSLRKKPDVSEWLYVPYWKPDVVPMSITTPTVWAIFSDETGPGRELVTRLRGQGHTVYLVQSREQPAHSDEHTWLIAPHEAHEYTRLLSALAPAPQRILYCVTEEFDCYGLLFLAQALERQTSASIRLDVITRNAQQVFDNETVNPAQAMPLGLALVIPQEYPHVTCHSIDLAVPAQAWQAALLYDNLLSELMAEPTDQAVAYRGARRWVPAFRPVQPPDGAIDRLREGGVYLITGGLSPVGRALARHLAETLRAKLVLLDRVGLPPRDDWERRLATQDPADPALDPIRFIQDLEAQRTDVLALAVDVTDREQMRAAIAQARRRFGALHGVLHVAGVAGDEAIVPIQEARRPACEAIFHAKVQGTSQLAEALVDQELDFCALFSSLTAIVGGLGLGLDAAANRFMDAFALQHNQLQPTPWLSVNWDRWQFAEDNGRGMGLGASGAHLALSPEEGVQVFRRVLSLGYLPQVVVSTGDLQARLDQWVKPRGTMMSASAAETSTVQHVRPHLQSTYVAPRDQIEQEVATIWQQLLGIAEVGVYDSFFDLGGHSLLATQVISRVRQAFAIQLPIRRLLESPTVADLALAVVEEQLAQVDEKDKPSLEAVLSEVEDLSDDELQRLLAE